MKGTEFVVRIPAAPPELQDEFAHSTWLKTSRVWCSPSPTC